MTRRTYARGLVAVCLVFAILLGIIAALRPADIDEGYFVASAAFVEQGQRPYHDFLFPQMPVMAYLPAAVTNLLPARTLPWARAIFVLFSAGAVALGPRRAEVRAVLDKHYEKVHESQGVVVFRALPAP